MRWHVQLIMHIICLIYTFSYHKTIDSCKIYIQLLVLLIFRYLYELSYCPQFPFIENIY